MLIRLHTVGPSSADNSGMWATSQPSLSHYATLRPEGRNLNGPNDPPLPVFSEFRTDHPAQCHRYSFGGLIIQGTSPAYRKFRVDRHRHCPAPLRLCDKCVDGSWGSSDRDALCRLACKRPHALRMVHATVHEISAILITCPLLMMAGGHSLGSALALNIGLTPTYTAYTYAFHIAHDRLRPVQIQRQST